MKGPKSILLVEDNEFEQIIFTKALSEIVNATLFDIANNGKEALAKLENPITLPDLIFLDLNMPVMDGIECLTEIIKKPEIKHIIVIILSSDTSRAELTRRLGAKAFINKPLDSKLLRDKLEQMIHLDYIAESHIADETFKTAISAF